jgi:hypothetical protein
MKTRIIPNERVYHVIAPHSFPSYHPTRRTTEMRHLPK